MIANSMITVMYLAFLCSSTQADLIWDSGHHVFGEGYESHVTMLNDASADIIGGSIYQFNMYNSTSANISGGYVAATLGHDTSSVNVYEFSEISILKPMDSSTANLFGGEINIIFSLGNSNVYIYGGMLNILDTVDQGLATLYVADNYNLDPTGGIFNHGLLTGNWFYSGNSFSISLTENTFDHIICIPEPCSILLLTIGGFLFNRRNYVR